MAVNIDNTADLYGVELTLSYDASRVDVVDADPNTDGTQVALGDVFKNVDIFEFEHLVEPDPNTGQRQKPVP